MRNLISQRLKLPDLYFWVKAREPSFRKSSINTVRYRIARSKIHKTTSKHLSFENINSLLNDREKKQIHLNKEYEKVPIDFRDDTGNSMFARAKYRRYDCYFAKMH
jgi:hypothetical protein